MSPLSQKSSSAPASPSRTLSDADNEEKRVRILDAAQSLFLRYGIKRTSIDDVASEAGIAKGTVYLYFESKSALFAALGRRLCAESFAQAQGVLAEAKPFNERIVDFLDCHIGRVNRLIANSPHISELSASKDALATAIYDDHNRRMKSLLVGLLKEANMTQPGATEMFLAAAIGTLRTGNIAEKPYRARLTAIINALIAGLTHNGGSP
jgi:AcrR family transcriptional regulator